jgi:hypothetical protein
VIPATAERPMAARKRSERDDVAVKIDRRIALKAKMVASERGITMAEYISEMIRSAVERDFAKTVSDISGNAGGPRRKAKGDVE